LRQRWLAEAGVSAAETALFAKWLVARDAVTDYQAAVVLGRRSEPLWLGEFKVLSRAAHGRLAGVYKAVHQSGQEVAVQVLPPARARDPQLVARFEREARLAVKLQHPNVVRTFQTGVDGGVRFLVMEYLNGQTLKEALLHRGRLPTAEAVRLVYQA